MDKEGWIMKFSEASIHLDAGKRVRCMGWTNYWVIKDGLLVDKNDKPAQVHIDHLMSDEWEVVQQRVLVADYLIPVKGKIHYTPVGMGALYYRETRVIGQEPDGSIKVPFSEALRDE